MLDTEQIDFGLETQHDSNTSDEDTQDTQAPGGTHKGKGTGKGKADKRSKKPEVLFSAEQEQKLVDFLRDNEILYNNRLMDYKDKSKREVVWAKFCEDKNLDKDACQRWFQSQHTLFGKVTHMKSGQGKPQLTESRNRPETILSSSGTTSCAILQQKVNSGLPRGLLLKPVQQRAHHPDGRLCTWNRSRILLVQRQLVTQLVTSSSADSDLQAALAESQRGITELRGTVVKKFDDDKPDNPRFGFCDFLKVEVVQLTSDSYDEFQ